MLLPVAGSAIERIELTGADATVWQPPTGEWRIVGEVSINPRNTKLLTTRPGAGIIINGRMGDTVPLVTKQEFADVRAHIEFMIPRGSNSGVYFQGRYELQIFDSWGREKGDYPGIECGGIYQRWDENRTPKGYEGHSPRMNASLPAGQWQSLDVVFRAPRFDPRGNKILNACFVKVEHNGKVIHEGVELSGPTRGSVSETEAAIGPLLLQGDHGPVAYRNIWVMPISLDKMGLTNPFFAMDTATIDANHAMPQQQVEMVKELGYAGIAFWPANPKQQGNALKDLVTELSRNELAVFPVYFSISVENAREQNLPSIMEAVRVLGRYNGTIWLAITRENYSSLNAYRDDDAVELITEIADDAEEQNVKVALYPHVDFWMDDVEDALRLARETNRRNVGVTFNLYHWLRTGDPADMEKLLSEVMPYLSVVTINGSSTAGSIEPLGEGTFDVYSFLKALNRLGFEGPIGLQGYAVQGDVHKNLKRSMETWRRYSDMIAADKLD